MLCRAALITVAGVEHSKLSAALHALGLQRLSDTYEPTRSDIWFDAAANAVEIRNQLKSGAFNPHLEHHTLAEVHRLPLPPLSTAPSPRGSIAVSQSQLPVRSVSGSAIYSQAWSITLQPPYAHVQHGGLAGGFDGCDGEGELMSWHDATASSNSAPFGPSSRRASGGPPSHNVSDAGERSAGPVSRNVSDAVSRHGHEGGEYTEPAAPWQHLTDLKLKLAEQLEETVKTTVENEDGDSDVEVGFTVVDLHVCPNVEINNGIKDIKRRLQEAVHRLCGLARAVCRPLPAVLQDKALQSSVLSMAYSVLRHLLQCYPGQRYAIRRRGDERDGLREGIDVGWRDGLKGGEISLSLFHCACVSLCFCLFCFSLLPSLSLCRSYLSICVSPAVRARRCSVP